MASDDIGDLFADTSEQARRKREVIAANWSPGWTWSEEREEGWLTTRPAGSKPDEYQALAEYLPSGLDPEGFVLELTDAKAWDGWTRTEEGQEATSAIQHSYRFKIRRVAQAAKIEVEEAAKYIRRHKPKKTAGKRRDSTLILCASDFQIGKGWQYGEREGYAWQRTADLWTEALEVVADHWKATGKPRRIMLAGLGDLVEGCRGHYPGQTYNVELNDREQDRVVFELLLRAIKRLAPMVEEMLVAPVGGNHGENRANGKAFTDTADNRDVAIFGYLERTLAMAGEEWDHVRFMVPHHELTQTIDLHGTLVGLAHGHQWQKTRGATIPERAKAWWKNQMAGQLPIGDATLLLHGHYHHLYVTESMGNRTIICAPALDPGSGYMTNTHGARARPGVLTLIVDESGWDHLRIA